MRAYPHVIAMDIVRPFFLAKQMYTLKEEITYYFLLHALSSLIVSSFLQFLSIVQHILAILCLENTKTSKLYKNNSFFSLKYNKNSNFNSELLDPVT